MEDETTRPLKGDLGDLRAVSVISQVSLVEDDPCILLQDHDKTKYLHH